MLSDHLLMLGFAVLFEMYLLCSCSPIPLAIAELKPKNATATFQAEKEPIQTALWATMLQSEDINPKAQLNEETSECVCQTAGISGDTSNCRFQYLVEPVVL